MQVFNIVKLNNGDYTVKTTYNEYFIKVDAVKGIGIYLEYEGGNCLIKQYYHQKIETAINFLFKKEIF